MSILDTPLTPVIQGALNNKVSKGELFINVKDYGVVADGITDDYSKLVDALSAAATFGVPAALPANAVIALGAKIAFPAGLTLHTNGATLKGLVENSDYLVTLASNTRITGPLKVVTPSGAVNVRGVLINAASNVSLDAITVESPTTGAGAGNNNACGFVVTGSSNVSVGTLAVTNFDFPAKVTTSSRVRIGWLDFTAWLRGIYLSDCTNFSVTGGGLMRTASPNAALSPGHNGVLIDATAHDATNQIRLNSVVVQDSGEHAFRVGGNKRVKQVWFNNCAAVNAGGCGFKVLGGTEADNNYHEDIYFNSPIIEDAGQGTTNAAGVMVQFVRRVEINTPIVRKSSKANSAGHGVEIQAAENVITNNPIIQDTLVAGYAVEHVLGNCTNVRLNGGTIGSSTGDGILINYSGRTFRRVSVENFPQVEIGGTGHNLNIINSGGAVSGTAKISYQSVQGSSFQLDPAAVTAGYVCDIMAAFATNSFKNGSRWVDPGAGLTYSKTGNAWFIQDLVCTTATRPTTASIGQRAFDTTIGKPIVLKSTGPDVWVDGAGTTV